MPSPGKIAFAWVVTIAVIITCGILFLTVDPQVEIWSTLIHQWLPRFDATSSAIIAIYKMSLLIVAIGTIIWACITSFSDETDSYDTYGGM